MMDMYTMSDLKTKQRIVIGLLTNFKYVNFDQEKKMTKKSET